eukprot:5116164-Amphidinium_carterae.1
MSWLKPRWSKRVQIVVQNECDSLLRRATCDGGSVAGVFRGYPAPWKPPKPLCGSAKGMVCVTFAAEECKSDRAIVLAAVQGDGHALECAAEECKADHERLSWRQCNTIRTPSILQRTRCCWTAPSLCEAALVHDYERLHAVWSLDRCDVGRLRQR